MIAVRPPRHGAIRPGAISMAMFLLLQFPGAWALAAAAPPASDPAAAALSRDSERCRVQANLDACYDAVRRNPRDAGLLIAMGDALERAHRSAEAVRAYHRAAVLAPNDRSIAAKINAAEVRQFSGHAPPNPAPSGNAGIGASSKRVSNTDPAGQSH